MSNESGVSSPISRAPRSGVGLFSNSLLDIIEIDGAVRYWCNLGNGRFGLPSEMHNAPGRASIGPRRRAADRRANGEFLSLANI